MENYLRILKEIFVQGSVSDLFMDFEDSKSYVKLV